MSGVGTFAATVGTSGAIEAGAIGAAVAEADAALESSEGLFERTANTTPTAAITTTPPTNAISPGFAPLPFGGPAITGTAGMAGDGLAGLTATFVATVATRTGAPAGAAKLGISGIAAVG